MPKTPPTKSLANTMYIGIDPGQSGGLAQIIGGSLTCIKMPPTERDIWDWIQRGPYSNTYKAVIEKVHSMPGQGVASTFKFGKGYGGLRMALIAASISFEEITPRAWQKALSIPPRNKTETHTQFKNRLKAFAQQLFPTHKLTLATCDAALIAEFCRRKHEGVL